MSKKVVATDPGVLAPQARSGGTASLPEGPHRAVTLAPPEPATSLRYVGRRLPPLPLDPARRRFSIGAGDCDLVIPREISKNISAVHAVIDRRGSALEVRDQGSKNGSYRTRGEPHLAVFPVPAGQTFWLADVQFQSMDPLLDVLRRAVAWSIGLDNDAAIDAAIEAVSLGGPLALVGPPGCDAELLAAAIHAASTRRNNFFLVATTAPLPSLEHARSGTTFVDLRRLKKVPAAYVAALLDGSGLHRPIFAADDPRDLRKHLDEHDRKLSVVTLTPLARRRKEVPRLLAYHWAETLRTHRRIEELGAAVDALARYDWPRGVEELREHSPRILAYLEHGTLRDAAAALGVAHQTLAKHFQRIGLPIRSVPRP